MNEVVNVTTGCGGGGGPVDSDGDGTPDNQDCAPNNASLPASPGTACNDFNPNTSNDQIQGDGCTCAGTAPAADADNDGTPDNQDCAPFNPNLPTAPGTACSDFNPNLSLIHI